MYQHNSKVLELQIRELSKSIDKAHGKKSNDGQLMQLLNKRGNLLRRAERFHLALEDHKLEIQLSEKPDSRRDKNSIAMAYYQFMETCLDLRDGNLALEVASKYTEVANSCGLLQKLNSYFIIGRVYLESGEKIADEDDGYFFIKSLRDQRAELYEKADEQFRDGIQLTQRTETIPRNAALSWVDTTAGIYLYNGILKYRQEKYDESSFWIQKAINEPISPDSWNFMYKAHRCLCNQYWKTKSYDKMVVEARKAFTFGKLEPNPAKQIDSKLVKAKAYFLMNNLKKGIRALGKTCGILATAIQTGFWAGTTEEELPGEIKNEICSKYDAATFILKNLITLDNHNSQATSSELKEMYEKLADNYVTIENLDKALEFYLKAAEFIELMGAHCSRRSKAALYASIALTYHDKNDYENAIGYYEMELDLHRDMKEIFKTKTLIAKCKYRAREVSGCTKYTVDDVLQDHLAALNQSKAINDRASRLDAINNYCHCVNFYEINQDNGVYLQYFAEKRKWLDSVGMTEEQVKAEVNSMEAAAQIPDNHEQEFELLAHSNEISSSDEDDGENAVPPVVPTCREDPAPLRRSKRRRLHLQAGTHPPERLNNNIPSVPGSTESSPIPLLQTEGTFHIGEVIIKEELDDVVSVDLNFELPGSPGSLAGPSLPFDREVTMDSAVTFQTESALHMGELIVIEQDEEDEPVVNLGPTSQPIITGLRASLVGKLADIELPNTKSHGVHESDNSSSHVHMRVKFISNGKSILVPIAREDLNKNVGWFRKQCLRRLGCSAQMIISLSTEDNFLLQDEDSLLSISLGAHMNVLAECPMYEHPEV